VIEVELERGWAVLRLCRNVMRLCHYVVKLCHHVVRLCCYVISCADMLEAVLIC